VDIPKMLAELFAGLGLQRRPIKMDMRIQKVIALIDGDIHHMISR
jgi:hypothetical protein